MNFWISSLFLHIHIASSASGMIWKRRGEDHQIGNDMGAGYAEERIGAELELVIEG